MLIKILYIIITYLCGSIPSAYIVAKANGKVDIRTVGSGNSGATNVFREIGKCAGVITLIADILKGFIPVYFATFIDNSFSYSVAVAAAAMVGHVFTIFLKFKGGKGVATGLGVFFALMRWPSLIALAIFGLAFVFSRYVSLGSICAVISLPLTSYFLGYSAEVVIFTFAITLLIIYRHRTNIKRLIERSENKLRIFKKK
ncbi:MAG: glycerol-3-phosphate 1-O-acyltransferase PlsY [Candidatus Endomicrobiellum trichonymphae]|uniref:glycerol-3-phosphate 1-O-acyltransferase PlsY n=1 Tax=Endomicrobium trichonymphae TaxID=1408204 RepID=UPI0027D40DAF|nr:MAG: glycerol-3-phosphate 1-O-acyltransferase PlsY [Candidatus Endomicrobium trichonymphae]